MFRLKTELEIGEEYFVKELGMKIGTFPFTTNIVSFFFSPTPTFFDDEVLKDITEQEWELLNWIKESGGDILLKAAKFQNETVLDFLVKCGADVNYIDENYYSAADYSWKKKNFKILSLLLQQDSFFPRGFNISDDEEIRKLVDTRNRLHEIIKKGNVNEVKEFVLAENLKFYLNTNNESAAYTAIVYKTFEVYAYLKSIGAEFAKAAEEMELKRLNLAEKVALHEAMIHYFPSVSNAHIFYLLSKSRCQKKVMNLDDVTLDYYRQLDKVPEISAILKTVQYADYLDIIFDFDEEEISKVNPVAPDQTRGQARYKDGRIYIAAGSNRKKQDILGTLAHELTHMAMQILYKNDCNPYGKFDEESVDFFRTFKRRIRTDIKSTGFGPNKILLDALNNYWENDRDSELIVRIPHILVQYGNGRDWLEKNIPELLEFYKKIEVKCEEFIKESVVLKPKSTIRSINESVGEILKLKSCDIRFKNFGAVTDLLKNDKKIFLYKVNNTFLGVLKIVQGIFGKDYNNNYLVLKFKNFIMQMNEIIEAFFSEASNVMIIEVDNNPKNDDLSAACEVIFLLLEQKPNKRIVFVTRDNATKFLQKSLKDSELTCGEVFDDGFSLDDLDGESQKKILEKKITFQGRSTTLKSLIQDESLYKYITGEVLTRLLENGDVNVGNEILGLSSLEGPYSDISMEIDFEAFSRRLKNSDDIFIIRSKLNDDVVEYFNSNFEAEWANTNFRNEKIVLVNDHFQSKDFKKFCRINSGKRCHLIDVNNLKTNSFVLQQFYNPNFYVKRYLKKIFIEADKMNKLVMENRSEIFIITNAEKPPTEDYPHVKWLNEEQAAAFLCQSNKTTHWFSMDGEIFTWKNSSGSVINLRRYVHKEKLQTDKDLIDEEKVMLEIINRQIVIIADNAGMGKSTTLTSLYEAEDIANSHWIIRINLKDHLESFRENIELGIVQFLQEVEPNLKNELNENLLKTALTTKGKISKRLLLAFDGFDEILDEDDRKNFIRLFKFLKNETCCKIWITSRLQYKKDLENELETFAIEFHPFEDETKKLFVKDYLKDRLGLILKEEVFSDNEDSKISIFSNGLSWKMNEIFKEDVKKFIGTPLELNLFMLGSMEYFKDWAENTKQLELNYLGRDLLEVFENFIQKKYAIYCKKLNITEKKRQIREKKISEKYNKDLAESLVCEHKTLKPEDEDKELFLLVGLVQSRNDENFEFIHFTFREYYFSQIFAEYALSESLYYEKMIFLFDEIFVKREHEMIRNFLNIRLKDEKLPEAKLDGLKKVFTRNLAQCTTSTSALAVAAKEGHENIFNFIYLIYFHLGFKITDVLNRTLFAVLSLDTKQKIWEVLLRILKNLNVTGKWEHFYYKFLIAESIHFATERRYWKLTKLLLENVGEMFEENEVRDFLTIINEKYGVFGKIIQWNDSIEMLEFILRIGEKFLSNEKQQEFLVMTKSHHGPTALHAAAAKTDPRFMATLLEKWEVRPLLSMRENCGGTILHKAAKSGNLEICKLLLEKLDLDKQKEYIMLKNYINCTALRLASDENRLEVLKFLVEKAEKIFEEEKFVEFLTLKNNANQIVRQLAINAKNFECVKFLFEKGEKILSADDRCRWLTMTDHFHGSVFHEACLHGDSNLLDFVLVRLSRYEFLLAKNKRNNNCLHLAVQKGRTNFLELLFEKLEGFLSLENQRELFLMKNNYGRTVLHQAALLKDPDIIKCLLGKIEKLLATEEQLMADNENLTFLHLTVREYPIKFVGLLLDKYEKKLEKLWSNIYHVVVSNEDPEVSKLIFKRIGENFDAKKQRELLLATNKDGDTILHLAARENRKVIMKSCLEKLHEILSPEEQSQLLLKKNISKGDTVLHEAALNSDPAMLKLLFQKTENILTTEKQREFFMTTNRNKESLLHKVPFGHSFTGFESEIAKLILKKAEDILSREQHREFLLLADNSDRTAFELFAKFNRDELLKILLEKIEKVLKPHDQEMLMTKEVNYIHFSDPILHVMAYNSDAKTLGQLLEFIQKVFPPQNQLGILFMKNRKNQTALHAIFSNFISSESEALTSILEKLEAILTLEHQRQIFMMKDYGSVLHTITLTQSLDIVKLVFGKAEKILGKDFPEAFMMKDDKLGSVLHAAVLSKELEVVKFILDKAKTMLKLENLLMMTDSNQRTVLHLSAKNDEPELGLTDKSKLDMMRFKHHLDDEPKDRSNMLNLFLNEGERILKEEVQREFLTMKDSNARTALHSAAESGEVEALKLLLQAAEKFLAGEDLKKFVMARDIENKTALDCCASDRMIKCLLSSFVDEKFNCGYRNHLNIT